MTATCYHLPWRILTHRCENVDVAEPGATCGRKHTQSIRHLCTHTPANPYCNECRVGKGLHYAHRSGALKKTDYVPKKDGDLMTCDYIIVKAKSSAAVDDEKVLLVMLDVATEWLTAFPAHRRTANYTILGFIQHTGLVPIKYARIDDAKELVKARRHQKIPYEASAPYEHQANSLIEVHNRIEIYGAKCSLEQYGAPNCFWPWAAQHMAFSRNIFPLGDKPLLTNASSKRAPFRESLLFSSRECASNDT